MKEQKKVDGRNHTAVLRYLYIRIYEYLVYLETAKCLFANKSLSEVIFLNYQL